MPSPKQIRNFTSILRAQGFGFKDGKRIFGIKVINKTGSDIAADKLVAISGYDVTSGKLKVVLADADVADLATDVYVALGKITNGKEGNVYKGGYSAANLDTSGATTVGDPLFLSTTAGAFTSTAPTGINARQQIVGHSRVKSSTVGQIHWDIKPASVLGSQDLQAGFLQTLSGSISVANIVGTAAGQLGHANGVVLVPACAAGSINQFVSLVISNDFLTAAYTGGGNTTVNISGGGAALSGLVSNANFIQAASDKIIEFVPLAATFNTYGTGANGIALVTASAPTQPGTAAGIFNYVVTYRTIPAILD